MDFTNLMFNPLSRMNEVIRYSSVYQESEESLAEHVTEVSITSYLISNYLKVNFEEDIEIGLLLEKSLLHDADEVLTGDVPRNTKYATPDAHNQLNKVASEAVDMIDSMVECSDIKAVWENSKSGKEGFIVKIVDMLVVAKKAITEIELRGNLTFLKVVTELEDHLNNMLVYINDERVTHVREFSKESVDYLAKLVKQANDEIVAIRVKYNHIIEKFMIKENVIRGE